jgi:hypothetical protein
MSEKFEPSEKSEKTELIHSFFELSDEQKNILKQRVEDSNGRIIAFVHPYYPEEKSLSTDIGWANPKDLERMRQALEKMLKIQKQESPAIFMFEEAGQVGALIEKLGDVLNRDAYVIPTEENSPLPKTNGGWQKLRDELKDVGVKNVTLAGMNLTVTFPDEALPYLDGCIAGTAEELSKEFGVNASNLMYPNSREDYYEFGGPTGPESHN